MKSWFNVVPAIALATLFYTQETSAPAPVPVEQEPHHHLVLKNDNLLVLRVTLQPGELSLYHIHSVTMWPSGWATPTLPSNFPTSLKTRPSNRSRATFRCAPCMKLLSRTGFTMWGRDYSTCWTWNFSTARNILPLALPDR